MRNLLIALLAMIASLFICHKVSFRQGVRSVESKTVRDTVWKRIDSIVWVKSPLLVWREPVEKPQVIDTAAVIADYYSRKVYAESIQVDSFLYVNIVDTLEKNALISRKISYSLNIPTVIERQKKPNLTVSVIGDSRYYAGAQIGWKRVLFNAGYDFKDRFPVIGVGLKIYER